MGENDTAAKAILRRALFAVQKLRESWLTLKLEEYDQKICPLFEELMDLSGAAVFYDVSDDRLSEEQLRKKVADTSCFHFEVFSGLYVRAYRDAFWMILIRSSSKTRSSTR